MRKGFSWIAVLGAAAMLTMALVPAASANGLQADMHIGRIWTAPENDGDASDVMQWPAGIVVAGKTGDGTTGNFKRGWIGIEKKGGTYAFCTNWTDPDGTVWDDAGSYMFRSMNYDYPESYLSDGQFNYVYPVNVQEYVRYEQPALYIRQTADPDTLINFVFHPGPEGDVIYAAPSGTGPRPTPIVDPTLVTDKVLENSWRYIMGVEMNRKTYAFAHGTQHQDYVIHDMVMTNNGISGRQTNEWGGATAEPPVLDNQSITNFPLGAES